MAEKLRIVEESFQDHRQASATAHRHDISPCPVAKAMGYMLKRGPGFTRFLEDGRICLTKNAAERALRGIALGRKAWPFAGFDRGGDRATLMYTLIVTAKMNDVDPQPWFADVLARIAEHPFQRLGELLPWNWKKVQAADTLAALFAFHDAVQDHGPKLNSPRL